MLILVSDCHVKKVYVESHGDSLRRSISAISSGNFAVVDSHHCHFRNTHHILERSHSVDIGLHGRT
jgi:hypothetical protein